jgi:2-dehydropantoate 2-reductase
MELVVVPCSEEASMSTADTIYVLGSGAVGFPLAASLAHSGRHVVAVRTSREDVPAGAVPLTVRNADQQIEATVETVSLSNLSDLNGILVITAKAYANEALARALSAKAAKGPIVLLQNGVGVERPFLDAQFPSIYRCVLYVTSQAVGAHVFSMRPVTTSPIGVVRGNRAELEACVTALTTDVLPFRSEAQIEREVWKKAIINAAFNSICPLLEVDNGIFARDARVAELGRGVIRECVAVTERLALGLSEGELMEQLLLISRRSDGQLISTLQDLRSGRPTEIAFLNLAITEVGASLDPPLALPQVTLLGRLIAAKDTIARHQK